MSKVFQGSVLAGIMIAIGGAVYLSVPNTIVGSLLFSIGLISILCCGLNLFTGQIGYFTFAEDKIGYAKKMSVVWLGNLMGTFLTGVLLGATRCKAISERARDISLIKLGDNFLSIFILSFFCGMLMYLAVSSFKTVPHELGKYLIVVLCVSVFILSGFEHCVANMFYFSVSQIWSLNALFYIILMSVGNAVGAIFLAYCLDNFSKKS